MPPRLPLPLSTSALARSHSSLLAAVTSLAVTSHHPQFTTPSLLPTPSRLPSRPRTISTSILSSLTDVPSSYNRRIRRGRGPSSGKGKTSGRGHKGQKQHGHVPFGFEGGQTPLEIVHGKRGFENVHTVPFSPLNIGRLQSWVDQGRLPSGGDAWLTVKELVDSRCIHGVKAGGVKLLAGEGKEGVLTSAVNLVVARASEEAIRKVEAAGGKVVTRYHGKSVGAGVGGGVRRVVRGEADPIGGLGLETTAEEGAATEAREESGTYTPLLESAGAGPTVQGQKEWKYRLPDPTSRKDIEYYRDERKRGYLSHLVPEGEGPSLFFNTPGTGAKRGAKGKGAGAKKPKERGENRIF